MKTFISFVPHGINENLFFPIHSDHDKYQELLDFRSKLFQGKEYDFVLLFNSRNIRRKSIPDTLLAFKTFLDQLTSERAQKCCIVLHTQPVDDNGTDLYAVRDMLFGDNAEHHVIFDQGVVDSNYMNLLYNSADGVILLSSNEGWGLSLTEALMAGKPIIGTVTGGIQDQFRFQDDDGKWIDFDEKFSSNHLAKYVDCGDWAYPVFPSSISLQGSPLTPFIADDRSDFRQVAEVIGYLYATSPEKRKERGLKGREWVLSQESGMSAANMCKNITRSVDYLFENWEPREAYEIIKVQPRKKKHVKYPISL